MKNIRIAAVTCRCPVGEVRSNLETVAFWAKEAREAGATLVCFPELNVSGYSLQVDACEQAATAYGVVVRELSAIAVQYKTTLLAGTVKKDSVSGLFLATHLIVSASGTVATYHKLHIAPPEKNIFRPGTEVPLFETSEVKFGVELCYDAHFPELSSRLAINGADIIFMPHASPRGNSEEKYNSWMRHLPARAFDNSLFVVACNQSGDNGTGSSFPALAMIIGPSGQVISKRIEPEGMVLADLISADLTAVREHRMRYFLPHRRPEIY